MPFLVVIPGYWHLQNTAVSATTLHHHQRTFLGSLQRERRTRPCGAKLQLLSLTSSILGLQLQLSLQPQSWPFFGDSSPAIQCQQTQTVSGTGKKLPLLVRHTHYDPQSPDSRGYNATSPSLQVRDNMGRAIRVC